MFCVDRRIAEWRNGLAETGRFTAANLDELEAHLREKMEEFQHLPLSDEEAFLVASHRLGEKQDLTAEYGKVNSGLIWSHRFFWMIVGILAFAAMTALAGAVSSVLVAMGAYTGVNPKLLGFFASGIKAVVILAGLGFVLWACLAVRSGSTADRLTRGALIGLIAFLPVLFATRMLSPALTARVMGPSQYGQIALVMSYMSIGLTVLCYIAMIVLMLWLRKRSTGLTA
ncbi:MAG: ABC transporter ATP-binding protein [Sedimentisphaerales bacterium]|nr:ABC transporter ATP-binding protein [Sedimentisphaerales bacterium]